MYQGAPKKLFVYTGDGRVKTEGVYVLTGSVNGCPYWKKGDDRWLYSSPKGLWTITDDEMHFSTGWGYVASGRHNGAMPQYIQKWRGTQDDQWVALPNMVVSDSPSVTNLEASAHETLLRNLNVPLQDHAFPSHAQNSLATFASGSSHHQHHHNHPGPTYFEGAPQQYPVRLHTPPPELEAIFGGEAPAATAAANMQDVFRTNDSVDSSTAAMLQLAIAEEEAKAMRAERPATDNVQRCAAVDSTLFDRPSFRHQCSTVARRTSQEHADDLPLIQQVHHWKKTAEELMQAKEEVEGELFEVRELASHRIREKDRLIALLEQDTGMVKTSMEELTRKLAMAKEAILEGKQSEEVHRLQLSQRVSTTGAPGVPSPPPQQTLPKSCLSGRGQPPPEQYTYELDDMMPSIEEGATRGLSPDLAAFMSTGADSNRGFQHNSVVEPLAELIRRQRLC